LTTMQCMYFQHCDEIFYAACEVKNQHLHTFFITIILAAFPFHKYNVFVRYSPIKLYTYFYVQWHNVKIIRFHVNERKYFIHLSLACCIAIYHIVLFSPNLIIACAIVSEIFYRMGLGIEKASNEVRTRKYIIYQTFLSLLTLSLKCYLMTTI